MCRAEDLHLFVTALPPFFITAQSDSVLLDFLFSPVQLLSVTVCVSQLLSCDRLSDASELRPTVSCRAVDGMAHVCCYLNF